MIFTQHELNKLKQYRPSNQENSGSISKAREKFCARITVNTKSIYLGVWKTRDEARLAIECANQLNARSKLNGDYLPKVRDYVNRNIDSYCQ